MGFNDGVNEQKLNKAIDTKSLEKICRITSVKAGDLINIKPGTVHGTYTGSIVLCEVQQNSDITYRVYDFDRTVNGEQRDLHIEKAKDVIDYSNSLDLTERKYRPKIKLKNTIKEKLVSCS